MANRDKILVYQKPTIVLEEMQFADSETIDVAPDERGPDQPKDSMHKKSRMVGDITPFIKIGDFKFLYSEIQSMTLDCTGMVPRLTAVIVDSRGVVTGPHFPKNKPILSLYIRSRSEKIKPIRNDFLIMNIRRVGYASDPVERMDGTGVKYQISGQMRIPGLYNRESKVYDATSIDALKEVASEMEIGFAGNVKSTNDRMKWINPYWNRIEFIKYMQNRAFSSEECFFNIFIDIYYHLNMVNVRDMLSYSGDFDDVYASVMEINDYLRGEGASAEDNEMSTFVLSNMSTLRGSEMFISKYDEQSNTGDIILNVGNRGGLYYYDPFVNESDLSENFVEYDVFNEESVEYEDEFLAKKKSLYWTGIDYNNGHDNYMFSRMNQFYGMMEMSKMRLNVTLDGVNMNVIRGQHVPVVLFKQDGSAQHSYDPYTYEDETEDPDKRRDEKTAGVTLNRYLSGHYYVTGVKYCYNLNRINNDERSPFYTELSLARGSWPKSPEKAPRQ